MLTVCMGTGYRVNVKLSRSSVEGCDE